MHQVVKKNLQLLKGIFHICKGSRVWTRFWGHFWGVKHDIEHWQPQRNESTGNADEPATVGLAARPQLAVSNKASPA